MRRLYSGLANEILLDVYARSASFEPGVKNLQRRLFDAYAAEVARVDTNHDGIARWICGSRMCSPRLCVGKCWRGPRRAGDLY